MSAFIDRATPWITEFGFSVIGCDVADKGPYGKNARDKAISEATEIHRQQSGNSKARLPLTEVQGLKRKFPLKGIYSKTNTLAGLQALAATVSPEANYGICSDAKYTIFETDDRAGLEEALGFKMPKTFTISARPNRGSWIFEQTDRTRAFWLATEGGILEVPGLFEWRESGYVVGPGSIHPDTKAPYEVKCRVKPIPFPDQLQDGAIRLRAEAPSSKGGGIGVVEESELEKLLEALHKRGNPEDMLTLPDDFAITSLHPLLKALIAHLFDPDHPDDTATIVREVGEKFGHRAPGENDVEDMVEWHVRHKSEVCICDQCAIAGGQFVWSSRKNVPPPEHWYSDDPKWQQTGPIWVFTKEADFALFKHRAEQTPAWADAAQWKGPEGWPELPADYEVWKASQPPTENGFKFPRVPGQVREYALLPLHSKFDGWFGRGRVSIVGGSSGAGKTSLICDLLHQQRLRSCVLGHAGAGLRPLIIFADRGELSNAETFDRLGLANAKLPIAHLSVCWDATAAQRLLELVEEQTPLPEIVFVEGADALVSDAAKTQVVAPFLSSLQKIAAHYHIAFVLSVGAPKSKPREQHTLKRDRIFGSQIWPRMADTIATLEAVGDGTGGRRDLAVQHRNAPSESFELEFQNGRLVERCASVDIDALDIWISEREPDSWFTRGEAIDAMNKGQVGMKKTKVCDRIKDMLDRGALQKRWNKERKIEELRAREKLAEQRAGRDGFAGFDATTTQ